MKAHSSSNRFIVYLLTCLSTGKSYVGKTALTLGKRWSAHCRAARNNSNFHLHRAIRKYGPAKFEKRVLAESDTEDVSFSLESRYIKYLRTRQPDGYNGTDGGEGASGRKTSVETKIKMSASMTGLHHGAGNKNALGNRHTPEARQKIRQARLGKRLSEESRKKVSEAQRGKPEPPCTDEQRKKRSEIAKRLGLRPPNHKGKKRSTETLKKLSLAKKGKRPNAEQRKRMSEAQRRRFARERAERQETFTF